MNIGQSSNQHQGNTASEDVMGRILSTWPVGVVSSRFPMTTIESNSGTKKDEAKKTVDVVKKKTRQPRTKRWSKPEGKPARPLSAYNLFFRDQRRYILGPDAPSTEMDMLKKRIHCKTHGKIGFADLAKTIGARWQALEPSTRDVYDRRAREGKHQYDLEVALWRQSEQIQSKKASQEQRMISAANAAFQSQRSGAESPTGSVTSVPTLHSVVTPEQRSLPMSRDLSPMQRLQLLQSPCNERKALWMLGQSYSMDSGSNTNTTSGILNQIHDLTRRRQHDLYQREKLLLALSQKLQGLGPLSTPFPGMAVSPSMPRFS
jgi:hypothetical protein